MFCKPESHHRCSWTLPMWLTHFRKRKRTWNFFNYTYSSLTLTPARSKITLADLSLTVSGKEGQKKKRYRRIWLMVFDFLKVQAQTLTLVGIWERYLFYQWVQLLKLLSTPNFVDRVPLQVTLCSMLSQPIPYRKSWSGQQRNLQVLHFILSILGDL